MTYYTGTPITYSAQAATTGMPNNTFSYVWAFDDLAIASGSSVSHTWTSDGNHSATVTATDSVTGVTATAIKSITTAPAPYISPNMFFATMARGRKMAYGISNDSGIKSIVTSTSSNSTWPLNVPGWLRANSTTGKTWYLIACSYDGVVAYAISQNADLWKTTDSGATWNPISGPPSAFLCGLATDSTGTYVLVMDTGGTAWVSSNGGSSWASHAIYASATNAYVACSANGSVMAVSRDASSKINVSTNFGATWTAIDTASPLSRQWSGVAVSEDGTSLYAVASSEKIYTANNSGGVFGNLSLVSGYGALGPINWSDIRAAGSSGNFIACYPLGNVYLSTDHGATINGKQPQTGAWSFFCCGMSSDGLAMFAAAIGHFKISSDGGVTWSDMPGVS